MTKSSTTSAQPLHDSASDSDERPSSRAAMPPLPKPASKAVTKRKSGHNLSKFVVNNENSESEPAAIPTGHHYSLYDEPTPTVEAIAEAKRGKARAITPATERHSSRAASRQASQWPDIEHAEIHVNTGPIDANMLVALDAKKISEDGLTVLAAHAWQTAKEYHWPITKRMNETKWLMIGLPFLLSIPKELTDELFGGNLASALLQHRNDYVQGLFADGSTWTDNHNTRLPCIYIRMLYDSKTGRSLAPNELFAVLYRLRLYAKEHLTDEEIDLVVAVDEQPAFVQGKHRHVEEGGRHFFGGKFADEHSNNRARQLLSFCDSCQEWLDLVPPMDRSNPIGFPFAYVGYAMTFSKRIVQHNSENTSGSRWFMNLFLSACSVVLNDGHTRWGFSSHVIGYCKSEEEVAAAEALMTALTGAWYETGTGFGMHPSGENVFSAEVRTMSYREGQEVWKVCQRFRDEHTPYLKNESLEIQRIEAYPERCKQRRAALRAERPDLLEEARIIKERVTAEKNRIRREISGHMTRIYEAYSKAQAADPDSNELVVLRKRHMDLHEKVRNLGPVTDIPATGRQSEPQCGSDIESIFPGTDPVVPSIHPMGEAVAGSSRGNPQGDR
ncbi:hypothetical protein PtrSN002B_003813 [Pyrenophora tritici-repentis]|nr:hypothetical protein PtrV1_03563 [Pyrenophora tritici-repentis]KAI1541860.1 hypothetical protein PtrSN001A_003695 [Pyrenophora tritici-repentis]KAI1544199.1 hypothetical protein PtrSN001C_003641 [Pyrenophora tritici-repentis]KAI1554616.1 hypothetical protein PtrSN002B_003813 [Pyrenophora tritici-repentis]KAI1582265.1 hypothetical protein PtrEW7m1_003993 [Pyrenophora tritici-repentis]